MTHNIQVLQIEYDRNDKPVYAFIEDANGDVIRDFRRRSDLTKAMKKFPFDLLYRGRWDGETSGVLQGYRSCTTGGAVEKFSNVTGVEWDSDEGGWSVV